MPGVVHAQTIRLLRDRSQLISDVHSLIIANVSPEFDKITKERAIITSLTLIYHTRLASLHKLYGL